MKSEDDLKAEYVVNKFLNLLNSRKQKQDKRVRKESVKASKVILHRSSRHNLKPTLKTKS